MDTTKTHTLIARAYDCVPYYNHCINNRAEIDIDRLTIPDDFYKIPCFTKETIKKIGWANFVDGRYLDEGYELRDDRTLKVVRTSGTTQEAMRIPWRQADYYASIVNHWHFRQRRHGIQTTSRKLESILDMNGANAFTINLLSNTIKINLSAVVKNVRETLLNIRLFQPEWLYIQSSHLYLLLQLAERYKIPFPTSIRYIELIGEPVLPDYLNTIRASFPEVSISNMYGCAETNGIAYECSCHRLHILERNVYVEITDGGGGPVNGPGYICVTGYHNHAMPFIRYRLNDRGALHAAPCPCGNTSPVLELEMTRLPQIWMLPPRDAADMTLLYPYALFPAYEESARDVWFQPDFTRFPDCRVTFFTKKATGERRARIQETWTRLLETLGVRGFHFTCVFKTAVPDKQKVGLMRLSGWEAGGA